MTKRDISDGRVAGKDQNGEYISGKRDESRFVALTRIDPILKPAGKSLFDEWEDKDYDKVSGSYADKSKELEKAIDKDFVKMGESLQSIENTAAENEKSFQEQKTKLQERDSLLQEVATALFTGGTSGLKAPRKWIL